MQSFEEYFKENNPTEPFPTGQVTGDWFSKYGYPMIVTCTYCGAQVITLACFLDDESYTFCEDCAGS